MSQSRVPFLKGPTIFQMSSPFKMITNVLSSSFMYQRK